jgi:transcriptional/translational regulatory protein YebC/TACO1
MGPFLQAKLVALFYQNPRYNLSAMSGHSHWAGIKHKKEVTDAKRGKVFSKLLALISVAAKSEPNPDFNPRLRTAIAKAKEASIPQDNIERAVRRASDAGTAPEELIFEAYGPGGVAIIIEAVSDNRNRTVQEIKLILKEHNGKWAGTGSVLWAFEQAVSGTDDGWKAKFPQKLSEEDGLKLTALAEELRANDAVQNIFTNAE